MAYNYATATQTSPGFTRNELITAIEGFLAYDSSWTVLQNISTSAANGDEPSSTNYSVIQKTNGNASEDVFVHLWRGSTVLSGQSIGLNTSTGYTPGNTWTNQPGVRMGNDNDVYSRCSHTIDDIVEYHFFGYPEYFYCVFKTSAGLWRNFGFGHFNKLSSFTGGGFSCASYSTYDTSAIDDADSGGSTQFFDVYSGVYSTDNIKHCSQFRIDGLDTTLRYGVATHGSSTNIEDTRVYGANDGWSSSGRTNSSTSSSYNSKDIAPFEHDKMVRAPSSFSLTSPLIPIYVYFSTDFLENTHALVATLPYVFALNIKSLAVTQEITIQSETYVVFPTSKKSSSINDGSNVPNSYYFGFCMLKKIEP